MTKEKLQWVMNDVVNDDVMDEETPVSNTVIGSVDINRGRVCLIKMIKATFFNYIKYPCGCKIITKLYYDQKVNN